MIVFVPKEIREGETRVAATPETVKKFIKAEHEVLVEPGCGAGSFISDADYETAGAKLASAKDGYAKADVVLKIQPPSPNNGGHEVDSMKEASMLICSLVPQNETDLIKRLQAKKITCFSTNLIPRTTIAQKMDTLSSQASLAGYKAVILAASHLGQYFPMLMTAAGTVNPAKVVVLGAGVAGLQAIATARRLGAIVEASDVRLAVKEQVESLGAKFIEVESDEDLEGEGGYAKEASKEFLERQRLEVAKRCAAAHVVITTALIPGRKAPILVTEETVKGMSPGSVVIDLAIEQGGNCEGAEVGVHVKHGVTIVGIPNLPATMSVHASQLFSRNVWNYFEHMHKNGELDWEEEITAGSILTHGGEIKHGPTVELMEKGA